MKKLLLISIVLLLSSCSFNNKELNNNITILNQEKKSLEEMVTKLQKDIIALKENPIKKMVPLKGTPLKSDNTILSCKVSLWSTLVSEKGTTSAEVDTGIQESPMELIFAGINTENVVLKGNQGETELLKIDNGDVIYLLERTSAGYVNIFTYFTETGNILFSKQYNLFGTTYGTQLIGDCN